MLIYLLNNCHHSTVYSHSTVSTEVAVEVEEEEEEEEALLLTLGGYLHHFHPSAQPRPSSDHSLLPPQL